MVGNISFFLHECCGSSSLFFVATGRVWLQRFRKEFLFFLAPSRLETRIYLLVTIDEHENEKEERRAERGQQQVEMIVSITFYDYHCGVLKT